MGIMLQIKKYLLYILFIFLASCLEEYDPGKLADHEEKLSISGWLTDLPEEQVISVHLSTPINISIPNSLPGCHVEVQDDQGNLFTYTEKERGKYFHKYSEGDVQPGRAYRLRIITPDGETYESDYEEMKKVPAVDTFYYKEEYEETREIGVRVPGLKFYTDFSSGEEYAQYFKYDVWATYEFHTYINSNLHWSYYGQIELAPEEYIKSVCYITEKISDINLVNTQNLTEKRIPGLPLYFVDNRSQRLYYGYSAELRLLSITESSFRYWEKQKQILEESGDLFEKQPPDVEGNIHNIYKPDEEVFGFFGVSSVSSKRIFVPQGIIRNFDIEPYCIPSEMEMSKLSPRRIVFLVQQAGSEGWFYVETECFDCTVYDRSTVQKPDFWQQ